MKEKMSNLSLKIKSIKHKKYLILLLLFVIVLIVVFYSSSKKSGNKVETTPSPSSTAFVDKGQTGAEPKRTNPSIVYLFNRFDSLINVIGYTWDGNKIVYATKDGIFKLWKNEPIINTPIDYIDFNSNGQGIYSYNNDYFFFNSSDNSINKVGSNLKEAKINSKGTYILYQNNNSFILQPVGSDETKIVTLEGNPNISFGWVENSNVFYLYNKDLNKVDLYNINLNLVNSINIEKNSRFLGINIDGNKFITSQNGNININDVENKSATTVGFDSGATFYVYWTNPTEFILIETKERGNLGLFADYIWNVKTSGEKLFLANSFPIPNKLNLKTKISINQKQNTLIFSENKGKIWTLSLTPSYISTYSEQGVSFYNMPKPRE